MIATINHRGKTVKFNVTDPEDHIQKHWLKGSFYEQGMLDYIADHYQGGLFVDVGAHMGNHSVFFSLFCSAKVVSYEPWHSNYSNLVDNSSLNKQVITCFNNGISNKKGVLQMEEFGDNSGMRRIAEKGEAVTIDTLDHQIKNEYVSLIKIDVEGHELQVLDGARRILREAKPALFIECQTEKERDEVTDYLKAYNYVRHKKQFNSTPTYLFT